jgi:hypothetical protein
MAEFIRLLMDAIHMPKSDQDKLIEENLFGDWEKKKEEKEDKEE